MTWSAVGSAIFQPNTSTFSLTPGGAGDLILAQFVNEDNNTVFASSLSSSNVTWAQLGATINYGPGNLTSVAFAGTVTSTSTQTVTVSWTGSAPSNIRGAAQEFSSTVGSWSLDTQGDLPGSSTTNTWASLTPTGNGELYWGFCLDEVEAVAGSTSGYVYDVDPVHGNGMGYNLSCPSGVGTAPVWGDSTMVFGIMVLMREASAASPPPARTAFMSSM